MKIITLIFCFVCCVFADEKNFYQSSHLFEGDMLLSYDEIKRKYGARTANKAVMDPKIKLDDAMARPGRKHVQRHIGRHLAPMNNTDELWTDRNGDGKVVIPWTFEEPTTFSNNEQQLIENFFQAFEDQVGVIKFVPWTNEIDFIEVQHVDGFCASHVGKIGGVQYIQLDPQCLVSGIVYHEIMHAIGFFHEHTRPDRDSYVTVLWENIENGYEQNYYKRLGSEVDDQGVNYDYDSVMHYGDEYFAKEDGLKTLDTKGNIVGQRSYMTEMDIKQIQLVYKCSGGPRNIREFCTPDCTCADGEGECDTDSDCTGSLTCGGNRICGTARPTTSPTTLAPVTSRPTMGPHSPTIINPPTMPPTTIVENSNYFLIGGLILVLVILIAIMSISKANNQTQYDSIL
jgi:hypothetical protein